MTLEVESGKKIDVRVSDSIAVDRVDYYAYDERNADIDISKLPSRSSRPRAIVVLPAPEGDDRTSIKPRRGISSLAIEAVPFTLGFYSMFCVCSRN